MYSGTVFDVVRLLSSLIQSLTLLSYVAFGPLDILNFLEIFILDIVIIFFREWNGVEVDCIIKRKKITDITDNNIQQVFLL